MESKWFYLALVLCTLCVCTVALSLMFEWPLTSGAATVEHNVRAVEAEQNPAAVGSRGFMLASGIVIITIIGIALYISLMRHKP